MRSTAAVLLVLFLAGAGSSHAGDEEVARPSGTIDRPWEIWWIQRRGQWHPPRPILAATERAKLVTVLADLIEGRELGQDTESAALLALARTSCEQESIVLLRRKGHLLSRGGRNKISAQIIEESAVLGVGLLRRSDVNARRPGGVYDNLRERLWILLEDGGHLDRRPRTRAFAAFALGLLGDQPAGPEGHEDVGRQLTTARLFHLLGRIFRDADLAVAVLVAIGLQSRASVTSAQRDLLRHLAWGEGFSETAAPDLVAAWAASALGTHGGAEDLDLLAGLLRRKTGVAAVRRRAAAIALGVLGRNLPANQSEPFGAALVEGLAREPDRKTRHFARVSLAQLGRGHATLAAAFRRGEPIDRASAAIALALLRRDEAPAPWPELHEAFAERDLDPEARAGFCVAAGLGRATDCREQLLAILGDATTRSWVRPYAVEGLGLLGPPTEEETATLISVLAKTRSQSLAGTIARTIGGAAVEPLLERLAAGTTISSRGGATLALAETGDARAVPPLIAVLEDEERTDLERALACSALAWLLDPESPTSLLRLKRDANFGAGTSALYEVWATW